MACFYAAPLAWNLTGVDTRATATSGNSRLEGFTESRNASLTEARSYSTEASRLEETGKRYSRDLSNNDSQGFSSSRDLSQTWQTFVAREMAANPALRDSGYATWMRDSDLDGGRAMGPQRQARDVLEDRFGQSYVDGMHTELGTPHRFALGSVARPDVSSAAGVRSWGGGQMSEVNASGPRVSIRDNLRDSSITLAVSGRLDTGNARMREAGQVANVIRDQARSNGRALSSNVESTLDSSMFSSIPIVSSLAGIFTGEAPQARFAPAPFAQAHGVGLKSNVRLQGLSPTMAPAISVISSSSRALGFAPAVITSGLDGKHHRGTLHHVGRAIDVRANHLTPEQGLTYANSIRRSLPPGFDVLFEYNAKDNPGNRHVHIEWDPKPRRRG